MTEQTDPTVSSVAITSATGIQNSLLNAGDVVNVKATFSESVIVDNASGTPTLTIVIGDAPGTVFSRTATYASGSSSTALVFQYTIQSGDNDTNGISIGANALALNSGTIRDASGNYATITHRTVDNNSSYMVDNTAPTLVDNVSITSATSPMGGWKDNLVPDHEISVTATFSESVFVAGGPPTLAIKVPADDNRTATFETGTDNSTTLVFKYTIVAADETDGQPGIIIVGNSLALNGGTIKDAAGNDATIITHSLVTTDWEVK